MIEEGEASVAGMKLPRERAWYYNEDDGYLGTDTLVGGEPATAGTGSPRAPRSGRSEP